MKNSGTVVILIDALGYELSEGFRPAGLERRARLRSVLGFSQAALTTILTGRAPRDHGLWMMYSFSRGRSPFSWLRCLPGNISSERAWLRRAIRWKLDRIDGVRSYYSLYDVPRKIFPHLGLPARDAMFGPSRDGAMSNIFDHLEAIGESWRVWDYRVHEDVAFEELEREVKADPRGFYLLYTAGLDAVMHAHGTRSPDAERKLEYYRERIERILHVSPDSRVAVLGDHGMCDVDGTLDLISVIDTLDRKTRDGFIPFYDSTMARFRVLREGAGKELEDLLSRVDGGRLLGRESLERLGVFFPDGRFGDIIFLADRGRIILPSFMGSKRLAAMHGYDPDAACMFAVMLANFDIDQHEIDLEQVAPLIMPGFEAGDSL